MQKKVAIIIGAGPAGLTAAYELATRTDITPIVIEECNVVGGISRTIHYKGNRIDLGGHRFFSKSQRIISWWLKFLPLQTLPNGAKELEISYHRQQSKITSLGFGLDPNADDNVMLVRKRQSRILHQGKFFSYPPTLSLDTLKLLGIRKSISILVSYLKSLIDPISPERSLEDFFINRFGKKLYEQFFKSYTEKVWGKPCSQISAEWGSQRIKGVSIKKLLLHPFSSLAKQQTEASLIEWFLYPKYGPGQMWESVAKEVQNKGGEILINHKAISVEHNGEKVLSATIRNKDGEERILLCDFIFSSMPLSDLINSTTPRSSQSEITVANGLEYRHFITLGVLLKKLSLFGGITSNALAEKLPDNWLYIQEDTVKLGRVQIFNNWSPFLVADPDTIWIGLEYFCGGQDALWTMTDQELKALAIKEAESINLFSQKDVLDIFVAKMPRAYPGYFGSYNQIEVLKDSCDKFCNLFPIGRNGMHKYNNQDHSMLTAMVAVDNIIAGVKTKENIWSINTEEAYHEKS